MFISAVSTELDDSLEQAGATRLSAGLVVTTLHHQNTPGCKQTLYKHIYFVIRIVSADGLTLLDAKPSVGIMIIKFVCRIFTGLAPVWLLTYAYFQILQLE